MIVIVDYGMGNLRSILKKLEMIQVKAVISSKVEDIKSAEKLILPGVGHFGQGMKNIKEYGLLPILNTKVMEEKIPVLGVCLGMQLFAEWSEEGNVAGLGWIRGKIVRFHFDDVPQKFDDKPQKICDVTRRFNDMPQTLSNDSLERNNDSQKSSVAIRKFSIPHVGWNTIDVRKDSSLLKDISPKTRFYFTHSYHFEELEKECVIATTSYGYDFPSVVKKNNIYGTQFHPEKSHLTGLEIYKNFINYA